MLDQNTLTQATTGFIEGFTKVFEFIADACIYLVIPGIVAYIFVKIKIDKKWCPKMNKETGSFCLYLKNHSGYHYDGFRYWNE